MNNFNIVEALSQIAREKNVDRDLVVQTLADALISAAKKRYGNTDNFEADIDPVSGQMEVIAHKTVVEEIQEPSQEIELDDALAIDDEAQLGGVVVEKLDLADFGRNAIQTAKQILIQRVREAEREKIYDEFSGRTGQIEAGTVQQISRGDIILNLGRAEAAIPLKEQIRRERYRQGDTVRGLIYEILKSTRGPQVLLSRTHPDFLRKLFSIEVPEISEGIVEIHGVAREPGERAKIAVSSSDERVDPVGACVGVKGARVQTIVRELGGERIDIVSWSDEPEVFIARAISPANVTRVIVDRRRHHASILVEEDQLSLAIGKAGQNSKLAAQLTGWGLDIITEQEYQERRVKITQSEEAFRRLSGVSELIALSLATSGFSSIKEISESTVDLLKTVPGLEEEEKVLALKQTASEYLEQNKGEVEGEVKEEVEGEVEEALNSSAEQNTVADLPSQNSEPNNIFEIDDGKPLDVDENTVADSSPAAEAAENTIVEANEENESAPEAQPDAVSDQDQI